jgi:hypothetical protein
MAIDSTSSTSEGVPNQEPVSITREDDGSLSIIISADASATANADGGSSTGTEQAKNDVDGTDTSYPTDQAEDDNAADAHDEALMTAMEDLSATLNETIELLEGQSSHSTADQTPPTGSDTSVDASQIGTDGSDDTELAEKLDRVVAILMEIIPALHETGNPELVEFAEKFEQVVTELRETISPHGNGGPLEEPFSSKPSNIGAQFANIYIELDPSEKREIIDVLASGELGEDGKKIAELLPSMTGVDGQDFWNPRVYNEIRDVMVESDDAEEIIAAIESISE